MTYCRFGLAFVVAFGVGLGFSCCLLPVAYCLWPIACGLPRMRIKKVRKSDSDWVNSFIENRIIGKSESTPILANYCSSSKLCWLYPTFSFFELLVLCVLCALCGKGICCGFAFAVAMACCLLPVAFFCCGKTFFPSLYQAGQRVFRSRRPPD